MRTEIPRRDFLQQGVATAAALGTRTVLAASDNLTARAQSPAAQAEWEMRSSATAPWVSVRIVDSNRMPWERGTYGQSGFNNKTLFADPASGSHLTILKVAVGAPGAPVHYHDFHEWAYWLTGDFTNNESTSPYEHMGPLQRWREGYFLDRPAFSLHGGERGREEFMQSQIGGTCLIMEESDVQKGTHSVEPAAGIEYNPDFKSISHWAVPRIIDTIGAMPWEDEGSVPDLKIKRLVDDPPRGFRANIFWIPAGGSSEKLGQFAKPYHYKDAHEFSYVINGDLNIQTYKSAESTAEKYTVAKAFLIDRAPMSIWGLADGTVSRFGCVLLQVTYAKGAAVSSSPIEPPTYS